MPYLAGATPNILRKIFINEEGLRNFMLARRCRVRYSLQEKMKGKPKN